MNKYCFLYLTFVHLFVMFIINELIKKLNTALNMNKENKNIETEILQLALKAVGTHLPKWAKIQEIEPVHNGIPHADWLIRVATENMETNYYAEIKANMTNAVKLILIMHKNTLKYPIMLVAKYVNADMAEQLRQEGIEFIDTVGNVFINQPPLYVFVKGNRPPKKPTQGTLKRAFKPAGLKLIYAFLCDPGLENKTYREIVKATDVAIGTVDWIMKELKELGYLVDMGKPGYKLIQKENLLERWTLAYPTQLRPKLILGRYMGGHGWWQEKTLGPFEAQWGGEVAAAKLTQYLKPQIVTIYTPAHELNRLLIENRLKKDPAGDVEVLERFWEPVVKWEYEELVHPILIYADLLATGDPRNVETAKIIYERYIIRLVK